MIQAAKNNFLISPGATIGILGGGQLGRMLAQAATRMGYHTHIYCPDKDAPAFEVSKFHTQAAYDDGAALSRFAASVDVVTYEFENIPAEPIAALAKNVKIFPSPDILALTQHRVKEKQAVNALGIATAPFAPVASEEQLKTAAKHLGLPAVLKTASLGYDGKGQQMLDARTDLGAAWKKLGAHEAILEGFVDFTMEISVIVARGADGETACYAPVQNIHKNHILAETIVPAPISPALAKEAETIARTIAEGLKLVGILAVEMFVTGAGTLLVNELAPRPHNSGHWTIDAAKTSQFEQAVRTICGLKLGETGQLCEARMLNLIGEEVKKWEDYAKMPGAKVHLYGKKEIRPGRKMGHVTILKT